MSYIEKIKMMDYIVVGGPTATGKTELAIQIAKLVNGVLINADSVQIYKGLDIGSNKGNIKFIKNMKLTKRTIPVFEIEASGIEGMLFDIVEPEYAFNVSEYQSLAYDCTDLIKSQNKLPILVGGTGLYIDSVVKDYDLSNEYTDHIHNNLRAELSQFSLSALITKLNLISKETYLSLNQSDKQNPRRLIRLIEKLQNAQRKDNEIRKVKPKPDYFFFYPEFEKEALLKKIELRVEWIFRNGLVEEVQGLVEKGYDLRFKAMQSTGYKQVVEMILENKYNLLECIQAVKVAHKKYAKRQITWFEGKGRGYELVKINRSNLRQTLDKLVIANIS